MTYLNNVSLDKIKKWINMPLGRISHCEKRDTWQNKKNKIFLLLLKDILTKYTSSR
jgi:hypothetical protein